MPTGITTYNARIPGTPRNYKWPVRFDMTDGCLGVTQLGDDGKVDARVLLSPNQVRELVAFVQKPKKK